MKIAIVVIMGLLTEHTLYWCASHSIVVAAVVAVDIVCLSQ